MQTLWRVELLGCLQVTRGERTITHFRTQKTATLLAYLAYHRDRPHSRNVLMELFWPNSGLEAARHSLSVAFSSLRRQFEPDDVLRADNSSAQLNAAAVTTDVADFAAALQEAEGALDAGARGRKRSELRAPSSALGTGKEPSPPLSPVRSTEHGARSSERFLPRSPATSTTGSSRNDSG